MARYLINFEFRGADGELKKSSAWADMVTLNQTNLEAFTTEISRSVPMIEAVLITGITKMDHGESRAWEEVHALLDRANALKSPPQWLVNGLEDALAQLG